MRRRKYNKGTPWFGLLRFFFFFCVCIYTLILYRHEHGIVGKHDNDEWELEEKKEDGGNHVNDETNIEE